MGGNQLLGLNKGRGIFGAVSALWRKAPRHLIGNEVWLERGQEGGPEREARSSPPRRAGHLERWPASPPICCTSQPTLGSCMTICSQTPQGLPASDAAGEDQQTEIGLSRDCEARGSWGVTQPGSWGLPQSRGILASLTLVKPECSVFHKK